MIMMIYTWYNCAT